MVLVVAVWVLCECHWPLVPVLHQCDVSTDHPELVVLHDYNWLRSSGNTVLFVVVALHNCRGHYGGWHHQVFVHFLQVHFYDVYRSHINWSWFYYLNMEYIFASRLCLVSCVIIGRALYSAVCQCHNGRTGGGGLEWVVEFTTVYIPVRTGGIFYFPWHRHQVEGTDGYSVSSERHCQSRVNAIAKVPERSFPQWDSNSAGTVRSPVQANALTHSGTAPAIAR